jgi:hypothetical protein
MPEIDQFRNDAQTYVLLLHGVYYALLVLRAVIISQGPRLLTESVWMAIWFLVGLAVWQESSRAKE